MTSQVITVTPATTLAEFARICTEDNISGAPVMQIGGSVIGMVTKTDLIERLIEDHPTYGGGESATQAFVHDHREVDEIMNDVVHSVAPDAPLAEIASMMAEHKIHRVLVMEEEKLVGIVTSLDVLQHFGS